MHTAYYDREEGTDSEARAGLTKMMELGMCCSVSVASSVVCCVVCAVSVVCFWLERTL